MNRTERRRYAADLRALARSGVQIGDLGPLEDWTCDCTGCRVIRAGVCLQCAARVTALILEGKEGETVNVSLCSPACREAMERFVAERDVPAACESEDADHVDGELGRAQYEEGDDGN